MTVIDATISALASRRDDIVSRLELLRRRVRIHLFVAGFARVFAEAVALALLSLLIDRWLRLGVPLRVLLLLAALGWLAWETWIHIIEPLRMELDPVDLAAAVDRSDGSRKSVLAPRVATVLELPQLLAGDLAPSPSMVTRAVEHAHDSLKGVNFLERLDHKRFNYQLGAIAGLVIFCMIFVLAAPATAGLWARRWFAGSGQPWPQRTYLTVAGLEDGKIVVPRGEPFVLRAGVKEASESPEAVSIRLREGRGSRINGQMTKFAAGDFRYDVPPIQQPMSLEIWGGDDEQGPFEIEPVDRPRINKLELISQHPTEAKPTSHLFTGQEADLSFLPKTKLELVLEANVAIAQALVKSGGKDAPQLRQVDERHFSCSWVHEKAVSMEIELTGKRAGLTSLPTPVSIGLKVDQAPRAMLSYTGVRQRITPMARIPLTISARDDYGVVKLDLASKSEALDPDKKVQTTATTQPLYGPVKPPKELEVQMKQPFEVTALKLLPGALLSLNAIAEDDRYLGAQIGASRPASFRIVAPEELFKEILLRQQGERAKFRKAIDQAQKIRDGLNTVTAETAVQMARDHRTIQRESMRIATSLAESITEMRLNQLGSDEAYDMMDKNVLKPLADMNEKLMNPQRDALESLKVDDSAKVADAAGRQEQIIARMNEIMKQMSQWDSFVDVLNQLNEIIRLQEKAKGQTDELKNKRIEGVFESETAPATRATPATQPATVPAPAK